MEVGSAYLDHCLVGIHSLGIVGCHSGRAAGCRIRIRSVVHRRMAGTDIAVAVAGLAGRLVGFEPIAHVFSCDHNLRATR